MASLVPVASLVGGAPEGDRAVAPVVRELPDTGSAIRAAAAQEAPVRVTGMTTSTRVVDARPDGTLTATLHTAPQRVFRDGRWIGIDTTLVRRPDGLVAPRAVEPDLAFSGGGAKAPLVRYGRQGGQVTLTWPGRLPEPLLAGATATYPEVLPGVDLLVRAEVDGYSHHLVVKDARAARQPALRQIRLGMSTGELRLTATRKGGLEARDGKGAVVFSAPPATMWDSAGRSARVGVALGRTALVLTPDQALLRDPKARFPVTIDPRWQDPARTGWTKVFSGKAGTAYWQGGPGIDVDTWAKVGLCDWPNCQGIGVARSYFQFNTDFLAGKQILVATLNALVVYGPQCNTRPHHLVRANGTIDGGTTWNNAPLGNVIDTRDAGSNYDGCAGDKPVGFNLGTNLNAGGLSTYYIQAASEGDKYAWRKYNGFATTMQVQYNTRPDAPRDLATDPPLPSPCRWCGGIPYVGQRDIRLQATLTDPDGDNLYAAWRTSIGGVENPWNGGWMANGSRHSTAPISLTPHNGRRVDWWLHGVDTHWSSEATAGQSFMVDLVSPGAKPGVTSTLYPNDNRWHGGVGIPGRFTFRPFDPADPLSPAKDVDDIDHYRWGFEDPPTNRVDAAALGGSATVTITPPGDGPRTLYVRSYDRAGRHSETRQHRFYVRAGNGPLAQWSLDGNARDTAFLGERDGTPIGAVAYGDGAVGNGLRLGGAGRVEAPNTVRTDDSFTVTAWAKLDRADAGSYTVAGQGGANTCAFCLQYQGDKRAWVWVLPQSDSANPPGWSYVTAPATAGEWVHLAGIYDSAAKKVTLYVDGRLVGSAPHNTPWHGSGALTIGPGFSGGIDEVKVYDRVLSGAEVTAEVSRDNVQLGHWKFDLPRDGAAGATAVNAVPGGAAAVLEGGARYVPSPINGAVKFGGPDDYARTGAPVLRTDKSFTVGGWLWLDEPPLDVDGYAAAVTQDGAVNGGFYLGYRNSDGGKWDFHLPSADAVERPGDSAINSGPRTANLRQWTHVMAVHDAATRRIELYVDGKLAASATRTDGFNATGEFVVGRMRWNGGIGNNWNGAVDELRAYSRPLSAAEIQGIVTQGGVAAGQWRLDSVDGAGREIADASGRGLVGKVEGGATLVGGQSSQPDPSDLALQLDGVTGFASAPHTVATNRSFSATAWVRLEKVGGHYGVVSQNGNAAPAFKVEAEPGGRWSFAMFTQDVGGGGADHRAIGGAAQVGVWTHLAAVYDADGARMHLYVNGVSVATKEHTNAWDHATGRVQIGRNRWGTGMVDYFPGAIDDVTLYSRTLFADEIRTMAGRDLTLAHNWALDEPSGIGAADSVGARRGTLAGDAAFTPGRVGNAVRFGGAGEVSTQGVDVRTDASFTVTAWARLSTKDCELSSQPECKVDLVTIDGDNTSKFRLGHVVDSGENQLGAWTFEMPASDTKGAPATKAVVSVERSDVDTWVHLAGVYDAPSETYWLYVNGNRIGSGTLNTPWPHKGGLRIGRGMGPDGEPGEYWRGDVDDVRLYAGALDGDRVWALYTAYPAERPPATLPAAGAGHWKFEESSGTTAADSGGRGRTATLKGAAGWTGGLSGYGLDLNGTTGYAETAGPVVDTGRSFSVSAWAVLTDDQAISRTVVGQDGDRNSTFQLQFLGTDRKWAVVVPGVDADNPPTSFVLKAPASPTTWEWTHLAMSYDAGLRQYRLYVNGVLVGAEVGPAMRAPVGPFTFGRGRWNGQPTGYLPGRIDDVRVYEKVLTDGEVRKVHDDTSPQMSVHYRFDEGTGRDYTWQRNDLSVSGGTSYAAAIEGKGLKLDGRTGAGTSKARPITMRDSFTVSAWASLDRTDQQATVVAQDGARMSGYQLQYRPGLQRWVFGAPVRDADAAELAYVAAPVPATANRWTHLTGVYDYPARQLRLYVDGELAGTRDNVAVWAATGMLTVGRGKVNGAAADFFPGTIDQVTVATGAMSTKTIARYAGWPAPPAGQLGRFVNQDGDTYTGDTTSPPDGYRYVSTLGLLVPDGQPNTRMLYSCRVTGSADTFTSRDAACEDQTVLGEVGRVYIEPPDGVATIPIYRCWIGYDHFETRRSDCEDGVNEGVIGHTIAYAQLQRYSYHDGPSDHMSVVDAPLPAYAQESSAGWVSLVAQAGTVPLMSCREDTDYFLSTNPTCDGGTVLGSIAHIWTDPPPVVVSQPIYRCSADGQRFVSTSATCEGRVMDRRLGYVVAGQPIGGAA